MDFQDMGLKWGVLEGKMGKR